MNVSDLLQQYLEAFAAGDIDSIDALCAPRGLVEIPFLKPNRLIGKTEILKGHGEIFAALEAVEFNLDDTRAEGDQAIAIGSLRVTRRDAPAQEHALGVVAEAEARCLRRVSFYCDARNIRPWCDKTIM